MAVTPLVTGLQTMPSVAWVPIAILLFGIKPEAILFVTLAGSIPAVIMGTVAAIDAVPPDPAPGRPHARRPRDQPLPPRGAAGRPARLRGRDAPSLGVCLALAHGRRADRPGQGSNSLGQLLSAYQDQSLAADVLAIMVAILVVGLLMDVVVFSRLERIVLERRGLLAPALAEGRRPALAGGPRSTWPGGGGR